MEKKWLNLILILAGLLLFWIYTLIANSNSEFLRMIILLLVAGEIFLIGFGLINYTNFRNWLKIVLSFVIGFIIHLALSFTFLLD